MSLQDYLGFLADERRVHAFRRAIAETVRPGDVVLDVGTGLGTYALFAAACGARVVAVEPDPVVEMARQLAEANGLADRITFLTGTVQELEPPQRADVVVFEDFSAYLFDRATAELLNDVRARWLRPQARAIPREMRLLGAPVTHRAVHDALKSWEDERPFELDLSPVAESLLNQMHRVACEEAALLAEPAMLACLDVVGESSHSLDVASTWSSARAAELHGLLIWIDLELPGGVVYSNRPTGRSQGWDQMFLPLREAVPVHSGDAIEARVATLGPGRDRPLWWRWRVRVGDTEQEMDTFRAAPLSRERLQRARLDQRLRLSAGGRLRVTALELCDGSRTLEDVARELRERYPERLATEAEALRYVSRQLQQEDTTEPASRGADSGNER